MDNQAMDIQAMDIQAMEIREITQDIIQDITQATVLEQQAIDLHHYLKY